MLLNGMPYYPTPQASSGGATGIVARVGNYDVYGAYPIHGIMQYVYMPNTGNGTHDPYDEIVNNGGKNLPPDVVVKPQNPQDGDYSYLTNVSDYDQMINNLTGGNALIKESFQRFAPNQQLLYDVYAKQRASEFQRILEDANYNMDVAVREFNREYPRAMESNASGLASKGALESGAGKALLETQDAKMRDAYNATIRTLQNTRDRGKEDYESDLALKQMEMQMQLDKMTIERADEIRAVMKNQIERQRAIWNEQWTLAKLKNQPYPSWEEYIQGIGYNNGQIIFPKLVDATKLPDSPNSPSQQIQQAVAGSPQQGSTQQQAQNYPQQPSGNQQTQTQQQQAVTHPQAPSGSQQTQTTTMVNGMPYVSYATAQPQNQQRQAPLSTITPIPHPSESATKSWQSESVANYNKYVNNMGKGYQQGVLQARPAPEGGIFNYYLPSNFLPKKGETSKKLDTLMKQPTTSNMFSESNKGYSSSPAFTYANTRMQ